MHRLLKPIHPPATLGVIGGGQLGRFFALAARKLGYRVAVLDPDPGSPAMQVADERIPAAYDDAGALERLGRSSAAVTIEFESVPASALRLLSQFCRTAPSAEALAVLQDRNREKRFLRALHLPVAPFTEVLEQRDLDHPACYPGILKLSRQSNDGKGQVRVADARAAIAAWRALQGRPAILEKRLALDLELSVVLARGADGELRAFPPAENRHREGILQLSIAPARVPESLAAEAERAASAIAHSLDYVGVLAVEYFVCEGRLLVNEVAPRPHNSGHYTMEACETSQFEQQVRALCSLGLASTAQRMPAAMVNILGEAWRDGAPDWRRVAAVPGATVHRYGKAQARPGRKMAHATVVAARPELALARAEECFRLAYSGGRAVPQGRRAA